MRISDWSSDVCSSDLYRAGVAGRAVRRPGLRVVLPGALGDAAPAGVGRDPRQHAQSPRPFGDRPPGHGDRGEIGRATSELQSLMRISYAVFCLKKKKRTIANMPAQILEITHSETFRRLRQRGQ